MEAHVRKIRFDNHYAEGRTILHRADARVKTISLLLLLFSIVSVKNLPTVSLLSVFFLAVLIYLRVERRKLLYPTTITTVIFIIVLFTYGGAHVLWKFSLLKITEDGMKFALMLFFRVFACLSLLLIYLRTTQFNEMLISLSWLRLPRTLIELIVMMTRFVPVLSEEAERIYFAAKSRHAFSDFLPYSARLRNLGSIAGALFIRAFDRSENVYMGLLSRGYSGKIVLSCRKFNRFDLAFLASSVLLAAFTALMH